MSIFLHIFLNLNLINFSKLGRKALCKIYFISHFQFLFLHAVYYIYAQRSRLSIIDRSIFGFTLDYISRCIQFFFHNYKF